ncbi:TIGR03663 family protein, partial [bacterium]|nr:TIGR03663 family protein [bacterium]
MKKITALRSLFLLVLLGAFLFRLPLLNVRPMHNDEANQAVKFRDLLEKGEYRYDRNDHHGPTLYYLTLPFVWISSDTTFSSIDESTIRMVLVIIGAGLILLLLLLKGGINLEAIVFAGLFTAISPAMVYYSRYYIQEMLLIFFILGILASGWRYTQNPSPAWAAATGFFVGMAYATKETCIIAFGAIIGALILVWVSQSKRKDKKTSPDLPSIKHLLLFSGTVILVSFLLYSSFFQNLRGILDSVLAFGSYFSRAGEAGIHSHPWYHYLKMLAFSKYGTGPVWSEFLILALGLVGGIAAFC